MKGKFPLTVAMLAGILLITQTLFGIENLIAPSTNLQFPSEITSNIDGKEVALHATGVATRSKFFVNVYSIAHYMRHPVHGKRSYVFEEILRDNQPKEVVLNWVRRVDLEQMRDGFSDSIQRVLRYSPANIDEEIEQFLALFGKDIQSGDIHKIRWIPGGKIEVEVNGEFIGAVENPEFAKALWSVWFGPKGVVSRNRLISLVKAN